jgi:hypothetical protein
VRCRRCHEALVDCEVPYALEEIAAAGAQQRVALDAALEHLRVRMPCSWIPRQRAERVMRGTLHAQLCTVNDHGAANKQQ